MYVFVSTESWNLQISEADAICTTAFWTWRNLEFQDLTFWDVWNVSCKVVKQQNKQQEAVLMEISL